MYQVLALYILVSYLVLARYIQGTYVLWLGMYLVCISYIPGKCRYLYVLAKYWGKIPGLFQVHLVQYILTWYVQVFTLYPVHTRYMCVEKKNIKPLITSLGLFLMQVFILSLFYLITFFLTPAFYFSLQYNLNFFFGLTEFTSQMKGKHVEGLTIS